MPNDSAITDTEKYAQYLLGTYDRKQVRIVREIRPADGFMVDNEFIWPLEEGRSAQRPISTMLTDLAPDGEVVIYMPAVNMWQAQSAARAKLQKDPDKYPSAIIF